MKKLVSFCIAVLALSLVSCGEKTKELTLTSTQFNEGSLGSLVELVDATYTLNCKGAIQTNVQLRLKKAMPHFAELDLNEIDFSSRPLTLIINDEYGSRLEALTLDENSYEALKQLLKGREGDVAEATFSTEKNGDFDITKAVSLATEEAGNVYPMVYNFKGGIGKNLIAMTLVEYSYSNIRGAYYYKKLERMGQQALLYLKGERMNGNKVEIAEYNIDGLNTGSFVGELSTNGYEGSFVANLRGRKYGFKLVADENMKTIDFSHVNFNDFEEYEVHYGAVYDNYQKDVNSVLNRYEEYVNDYAAMIKKAAKGDTDALLKISELLEDAKDLQAEVGEYKEELADGVAERFESIKEKLEEAMESL